MRPHLRTQSGHFTQSVGFVLRAICNNKIAMLGQRLHSSHRFFFVTWLFYQSLVVSNFLKRHSGWFP